ncbi:MULTISPECIES: dGTP triphosphohydrolase [Methanobacterium]|uniref:DNTP triphosphohydrolase n=1 Tax=Methanobacterium veterum TaxID=408577 RepID=A0A9E5A934_9EURY|nr:MULTISPECIES: dNTP triphosphohydrolase [Methanobacterium]MCZ3367254.1 dNTP triphosphohydrolase [Methanobacterium veterum]MCZ3373598.1 dNTP triphosphohydrolase [Methanobacterium veterum]
MSSLDYTKEEIKNLKKEINREYAQKSSFKDRRIHFKEDNPNFVDRNHFSRDRDRIIFAKAFRRLEHKAQVYSHVKGDHYRTRLTHTIEVMQIARSIAKNLGLNEDLTEAIALGHDIGHTPFGHQGEDVLDGIMRGKDNLGGNLKYCINYCGFKHNFNGLRTVDILEKKYGEEKGLNLTWQVLDGILKHTDVKKPDKKFDIKRFIQCKEHIPDFIKYPDPVTLEGQIVAIADEIAQRQHDLDDGLRDKDLKLDEDQIIGYINKNISKIRTKTEKNVYNISDLEPKYYSKFASFAKDANSKDILEYYKKHDKKIISKLILKKGSINRKLWDKLIIKYFIRKYVVPDNKEIKLLKELENKINQNKKCLNDEYKWNSLIRDILDYFIKDVTLNSLEKLNKLLNSPKNENHFKLQLVNKDYISCKKSNVKIQTGNNVYWHNRKYFDSKIIDFSDSGSKLNDEIEYYIKNRILNSYNVNVFDGKAIYIVRQLFKAFYTNPRQMPKETLDKLSMRIHENTKRCDCEIRLKTKIKENQKNMSIDEIEFRNSHPNEINELIKFLKLEMEMEELENIFRITYPNENNLNLNYEFLDQINGNAEHIHKECEKCDKNYNKRIIQKIFEKINDYEEDISKDKEIKKQMIFIKCILEHHYAYLSVICDHIAGMTDNYANNEYKKLYLV